MALYNITRSDITMENIRRGFFSCEGRLNRRRYIERFLAVSVICLILALFVYSIVFYATGDKTAAAGITSSVSVPEQRTSLHPVPMIVYSGSAPWIAYQKNSLCVGSNCSGVQQLAPRIGPSSPLLAFCAFFT